MKRLVNVLWAIQKELHAIAVSMEHNQTHDLLKKDRTTGRRF